MHKIITKVEISGKNIFQATFADGEVVEFDVSSLFEKYPVFRQLENNDLFNQLKIDGVGYGVFWNDYLDLSSDGIYMRGNHVSKVDPEIKVLVGQAVANAREEMGMSQRQLSNKSGVMQAEISKIEQGRGNPTILTLQKLAKSLGRTINSLLI